MKEILIAVLVTPLLIVGWVLVQKAWQRVMGGAHVVPNDRRGCAACNALGECGPVKTGDETNETG